MLDFLQGNYWVSASLILEDFAWPWPIRVILAAVFEHVCMA